jgi:hypothetical protein
LEYSIPVVLADSYARFLESCREGGRKFSTVNVVKAPSVGPYNGILQTRKEPQHGSEWLKEAPRVAPRAPKIAPARPNMTQGKGVRKAYMELSWAMLIHLGIYGVKLKILIWLRDGNFL